MKSKCFSCKWLEKLGSIVNSATNETKDDNVCLFNGLRLNNIDVHSCTHFNSLPKPKEHEEVREDNK